MTETAPGKLAQVLQAGQFAMTAETSPPDSSSSAVGSRSSSLPEGPG